MFGKNKSSRQRCLEICKENAFLYVAEVSRVTNDNWTALFMMIVYIIFADVMLMKW